MGFVSFRREEFENRLDVLMADDLMCNYDCRRVTAELSALEEVYEIDYGDGLYVRIYSTLDVMTSEVHRIGSNTVRLVLVVRDEFGCEKYMRLSSHRRRSNLFKHLYDVLAKVDVYKGYYINEMVGLEDHLYKVI